jgi:hypothetical protein
MKLYLAHLGFYDERYGMYEIHINKHVVAEDIKGAKQKLFQDEEFKRLKMHIDGLQEINIIGGYKISVADGGYETDDNPLYSHSEIKSLVI